MSRSSMVVLFAVLLGLVGAFQQGMLEQNKTPKEISLETPTSCDECKTLVKRFADALKDPAKLAELKIVLSMLCDETSYVNECKLFVSKLEIIAQKLGPFIRDATVVCQKFHICGNSKLNKLHKIGLLYAKRYMNQVDGQNDLVCDECQFAAQELKQVVEEAQTQAEIKQFISTEICSRLGKYRGSCDLIIEDFLPQLFEQLEQMLQNTKQFCSDLGLCARKQMLNRRQKTAKLLGPMRVRGLFESMNKLQSKKAAPGVRMTCLECKIALDAVLFELHTNESIVALASDVENLVCPVLPPEWLAGCHDFLHLYATTVVLMTVEQFTAESLCTSLHLCPDTALVAIRRLHVNKLEGVDCEACEMLSGFVGRQLNDMAARAELEAGVEFYLCRTLPSIFVNVCENLAETYVPMMLNKLQRMINTNKFCKQELHVC